MPASKKVVGIVERITILGKKDIEVYALFDTGAKQSSIDMQLASEAELGPIIGTRKIRQSSMKHRLMRPVVMARIRIMGEVFRTKVNIQDRSHMKFPVIIGRNINSRFLIDPARNRQLLKNLAGNPEPGKI